MLLRRLFPELDTELTEDLRRRFNARTERDTAAGMCRLLSPAGIPQGIVTMSYALSFLASHPGWTWEEL